MTRRVRLELRTALADVLASRGDHAVIERRRRVLTGPPDTDPLGDDLAAVLANASGGLSCDELALRVRRGRRDVLDVLRSDGRFARHGKTAGSRWRLAATGARFGVWDGTGRNDGRSPYSAIT